MLPQVAHGSTEIVGIAEILPVTEICCSVPPRFSSTTARLPSFSCFAQTSRSPSLATRRPARPSGVLIDGDHFFIGENVVNFRTHVAQVIPRNQRRGEKAHKLKCERYSTSVMPPLPTSSMSGSFQWPGPA